MNDTEWTGPYGESNVSVGCRLPGTDIAGSYSPYLFLSSDVGVAHGREVHGQPKKLGEPTIEHRGDLVVGTVDAERHRHHHRNDGLQAAAGHLDSLRGISTSPRTSTSRRSITSTAGRRSAS